MQFWGFSVLQRHGVSLPVSDFFPLCFPIWGPDVKVAKIHSSSKRKKEPKASFSMGFRSYVRHFRGAILGLLRPSEAWCFPVFHGVFTSEDQQQQQQKPLQRQEEKVAKIHSSSKRKKQGERVRVERL